MCCIKSKVKTITICGHIYKFQYQNNNKYSYYFCDKRKSEACQGQVILSPNGTIVEQSNHSCKLPDSQHNGKTLEEVHEYEETDRGFKINGHYYHFCREYKTETQNKYYLCNKICNSIRCPGSITISPSHHIIKKVGHTCNQLKNKKTPRIMITVDGYSYNFQTQYKNKNKYFRCRKKNTQKCRGSVTLSPKETIVRKRVHTCSSVCKVEETIFEDVLEYEESGRRFKINGHYYNLIYETKTGNKYYVCNKKHCAIKCRGSITITSDRKIVKKVDHICNLFAQSNFLPNQMSPS